MTIDVFASANQILPGVIDLRRKIHANPELGNQLPETTAAVLNELSDLGLEIRASKETTSLIATLKGEGDGPRILLRGDMDALPMPEDNDLSFASRNANKMHACGHDAHTAMLVGAARLLHENKEHVNGTVDFFFQTGEEGYYGAKVVLDEGMFEAPYSPDAIFALHITPLMDSGKFTGRPGPILAAADTWKIKVTGKGGHASMPHDALDPIPVACEIVQALQHMVVSRINAFNPVVLTTTKIEAGTTSNVIPESVDMLGTLRSTSERSRAKAHEGIKRIATQIAMAHEMEAEVELSLGYPVTVNHPDFVDFARGTLEQLFGEGAYIPMKTPMMGAEDFSYLLERWPGAMFFLGVKPDDPSLAAPCHSNRMILNEESMAYGIAAHAAIAMSYLNQPET
ncbi:M20 family metallopeptidase [Pseudomonadales bacterium]|nr:M20 family metallopeptidase [Pseudomonadales bacterium]MDC1084720.1 M20 family metallopeptidase [Pseudomonadales bacterium]